MASALCWHLIPVDQPLTRVGLTMLCPILGIVLFVWLRNRRLWAKQRERMAELMSWADTHLLLSPREQAVDHRDRWQWVVEKRREQELAWRSRARNPHHQPRPVQLLTEAEWAAMEREAQREGDSQGRMRVFTQGNGSRALPRDAQWRERTSR